MGRRYSHASLVHGLLFLFKPRGVRQKVHSPDLEHMLLTCLTALPLLGIICGRKRCSASPRTTRRQLSLTNTHTRILGVFPEGSQGPLFFDDLFCGVGILLGSLAQGCVDLTIKVKSSGKNSLLLDPLHLG